MEIITWETLPTGLKAGACASAAPASRNSAIARTRPPLSKSFDSITVVSRARDVTRPRCGEGWAWSTAPVAQASSQPGCPLRLVRAGIRARFVENREVRSNGPHCTMRTPSVSNRHARALPENRFEGRTGHPLPDSIMKRGCQISGLETAVGWGVRRGVPEGWEIFGGAVIAVAARPADRARGAVGLAPARESGEIEHPTPVHPLLDRAAFRPSSAGGEGTREIVRRHGRHRLLHRECQPGREGGADRPQRWGTFRRNTGNRFAPG